MRSDPGYFVAVILKRTLPCVALLALSTTMLTGCAPAPEPTATATPAFASEERAFAAAEEVYRAYIDAGNRDDDETAFLVGEALEAELATIRYLDQNGLTLNGSSELVSFAGQRLSDNHIAPEVDAIVCLDVSNSRVLDASGADVTPTDRASRMSLDVTFTFDGAELRISVSDISTTETTAC